jgi:hypothetical protein
MGARAAADILLRDRPTLNISVNYVWIKMLVSDTIEAAASAAQSLIDERAQHFYDPHQLAGKAVARRLGEFDLVAWDIYLFYSADSSWRFRLPTPVAWAHQMGEAWPDHYHFDADLIRELQRIATELF